MNLIRSIFNFWRSRVFSTDHRDVSMLYLMLALKAVAIGTLLSLLMRIHLVWPNAKLPFWGVMKPEEYLALLTMHGTMMIFFVLAVAPQMGFGCLIAPAQIGAKQLSLPRVNAAGFWIIATAPCWARSRCSRRSSANAAPG